MDTSETFIKMCEKATEIQALWKVPNGANFPDVAFTKSTIVFKREIRGKETSHFKTWDYKKENPSWIEAVGGHLGIIKARHGSSNNVEKFGGGFCATDKTFPAKEEVIEISGRGHLYDEEWIPREWCIWLPRQDQLQEMIVLHEILDSSKSKIASLLSRFWAWYLNTTNEFTSMEQLWLAFVQKENHGKSWNGEDWVKI